MSRAGAVLLALGAATAAAAPASADTRDADDASDESVVLVNAADATPAGDLARLRKRLDALGVLHPTEPAIAAALEGGAAIDLAAVRDAYADFDYDKADELLDGAIADALAAGDPGHLAIPLAEVLHWKGLVADATDDPDGAATWFAAAYRLDPERPLDRERTPPRVRTLIRKAREARTADGSLAITVDDEAEIAAAARVAVDGGPPTRIGAPVELPAGIHLVVVTAPDRGAYAELVRVRAGKREALQVELPGESRLEQARRVRDAALAAQPGKARLKRARPLARITGARRLLVIEGADAALSVRVYDLSARTVSAPLALREATRPSVLAELLGVDGFERTPPPRWYQRWYVWAGLGAVALGGVAAWELASREPTTLRGF